VADELKIKDSNLRLMQGDITDLEIDSFVYYAQHDLRLGSGYGTAISMRGGPSIQEELDKLGPLETTDAVVSQAGEMKAKYIIHAVGPRFQEEDIPEKLEKTVLNSLKQAEEKGIPAIAFPAMGVGFYGVPLDISARVTLGTIKEYLSGETKIKDVVVCLLDNREYKPFQSQLAALGNS
jgi:O-acetyl-ADP-ribose deacetylase (regulator of RNase III)